MGRIDFAGIPLLSAPGRVMTPRPASEQLVARALEYAGDGPACVADVGTGSGAIAIALATAAPNARVFASDTSRCAVALARANVRRRGLAGRVTVCHGDLIEPVPEPIDVVVANLPYLPAADARFYPFLFAEPHDAVFAAGDGLDPYRRLVAACTRRLDVDGAVVLQLHRRVFSATRDDLPKLLRELERHAATGSFAARPAALAA